MQTDRPPAPPGPLTFSQQNPLVGRELGADRHGSGEVLPALPQVLLQAGPLAAHPPEVRPVPGVVPLRILDAGHLFSSAGRDDRSRSLELRKACEHACHQPSLLGISDEPQLDEEEVSQGGKSGDSPFPMGAGKGPIPIKSTRSSSVIDTLNVVHSERLVYRNQT